MIYLLYVLFALACVALILSVLLQPGKADAGALFTNSISSTAFGPRGTQTLLAKITIVAAALFLLIALTLSIPAVTGPRSVLQSESDPDVTASPAQPTPSATVETVSPQTSPVASPTTEGSGAPTTNANNTNATASPVASPSATVQASPSASR